jgi:hypothetical protein
MEYWSIDFYQSNTPTLQYSSLNQILEGIPFGF